MVTPTSITLYSQNGTGNSSTRSTVNYGKICDNGGGVSSLCTPAASSGGDGCVPLPVRWCFLPWLPSSAAESPSRLERTGTRATVPRCWLRQTREVCMCGAKGELWETILIKKGSLQNISNFGKRL